MPKEVRDLFINYSAARLRQMSSHIVDCLGKLNEDQIWARGSANENAVGNLVLHLCGNARQWICSGVGGAADVRDRASEFSATGGMSSSDLMARLNTTISEATTIIEAVPPARLTDRINPQNHDVSVLEAIYQVVGHFQQHTGQIIFATKIFSGEDLGFYRPAK